MEVAAYKGCEIAQPCLQANSRAVEEVAPLVGNEAPGEFDFQHIFRSLVVL
jgi:hypothetical protein